MNRWSSWLAKTLLGHAATILPTPRAEWGRAMLVEAEHVAPRERLSFAIGCVWTSYRARATDAATVLAVGHWSIVLGLCAATVVCLRTAYVLPPGNASALILGLGTICLAATLAFIRWGFRRLPMVAVAGFAAALLAMLVLGDASALTGGAMPSSRFYRAILLEQCVAWAALFGLAHSLLAVEARRRANG